MRKPTRAANPTIKELIETYSGSRRVGDAQLRSLARVQPHFGAMTLSGITPLHVQSYLRKRRDVQDSTVRRELGALVAVMNWAAKTKIIGHEQVPHIDLPAAGLPRDLFMTQGQARTFEDEALKWPRFNGRVGTFIAIALNTAARKEAILQLTWDRVDLDAGTINFIRPGAVVTKKRRKVLPLNAHLSSVLASRNLKRCDTSNLVVGQGSLRAGYEAFTKSIGMQWVTPHILRHTAASLMLAQGVSVWKVAEVLGDTPATVVRVYGHSTTAQLQDAVNALGRQTVGIAAEP